MSDIKKVLELIKEHDVKYVDFRFTDPRGKWQHTAQHVVTVDEDLLIHDIEAVTDNSPFQMCPDIVGNFQRIKGLRMVGGFTNKMKAAVGGAQGCTHLVELMGPIATTAFQTIIPLKKRREKTPEEIAAAADAPPKRPPLLDSCHAFASDSPITKKAWPAFYTGPKDAV